MEASGELEADAVWEGAVSLAGDVVVPPGRTLRLRPGTALSFAPRPRWSCAVFRHAPEGWPIESTAREACDLVVLGTLEADGAAGRPVRLGAGEPWGGVTVLGQGRAVLRHARASGAREALFSIFDDARLELRDCSLSGAAAGVVAWGLSSLRLEDCRLEGLREGVVCREGSVGDLSGVRVRGAERGALGQHWALLRLEGCAFEDCTEFGAGAYDRSRLSVRSGRWDNCGRGLLAASQATLEAVNASLSGNRVGAQGIEASRLRLAGCSLADSAEHGVKLSQNCVGEVADCRIERSRHAGVLSEDDARGTVTGSVFSGASTATMTAGRGELVASGNRAAEAAA